MSAPKTSQLSRILTDPWQVSIVEGSPLQNGSPENVLSQAIVPNVLRTKTAHLRLLQQSKMSCFLLVALATFVTSLVVLLVLFLAPVAKLTD